MCTGQCIASYGSLLPASSSGSSVVILYNSSVVYIDQWLQANNSLINALKWKMGRRKIVPPLIIRVLAYYIVYYVIAFYQ